ncbi:hypothetical protein GH714_022050 [Hevea brasiliensis]|uniref:Protein kinase domain-containing protein n=1 Tax=Hevea brasiliensis TaxID=3981 RepID=A0A6A6MYA0_HEVBR|nr:hypothetical protein GH714_022050 [Hevea brasiliensis]
MSPEMVGAGLADVLKLIEPKDVVFECGPQCSCRPNCTNRVSQRQLKYRLEVYRVENKGWALRSWDFIPSGAPVCEYAGILRRNDELDNVSENDYIFDIDCWHTMNGIGGREKRQGDGSAPTSDLAEKEDDKMTESESEFCIDAGSCGNVARFINHSCEPNLFVQCVLSSHHDIRFARVVLVAADNIPPMQELTYDYGYALDSVIGPDGKIKQAPCFCGTSECRGQNDTEKKVADRYLKREVLGEGTYGVVYKAIDTKTGQTVAIKKIRLGKQKEGDMKPNNLLIASNGQLKLADFGLARIFGSPDRKFTHQVFARWYRAPELLFGTKQYGSGVDVWAAACIFAELLLRRPFLQGTSDIDQLGKIFQSLGTPTPSQWPDLVYLPDYVEYQSVPAQPWRKLFPMASDDALDLLAKMFTYDPKVRISVEQALEHRYFTSAPLPTEPAKLPRPAPKRESVNPRASDFHPLEGPTVLSPPRKARRVMPDREGFDGNASQVDKIDEHGEINRQLGITLAGVNRCQCQ